MRSRMAPEVTPFASDLPFALDMRTYRPTGVEQHDSFEGRYVTYCVRHS